MSDLVVWAAIVLLVIAGVAATRFNPEVIYARATLFRLAVLAVLIIGMILVFGFIGVPMLVPSGVVNLNGG